MEDDPNTEGVVHIKELPVNKWTKDFKEFIETLMDQEKVSGLREYHTKNRVHF
jgi:DNA gyrase/topoisomerase IV subunit A